MTKKLDKDHLDDIHKLRELFVHNDNTIGTIVIDKSIVDARAKRLDQEQQRLLNEFEALREQEAELMQNMRERYGDGQINIADGTFTPEDGLTQ